MPMILGVMMAICGNVQNLEPCDGSIENMGQKTTDAMVQSQHDCLVVRECQKAYQNVQF